MCVYSMIQEHWYDKYKDLQPYPNIFPYQPTVPVIPGLPQVSTPYVTREEFEKKINELIELLKKAKEYDKINNQKDCELEEKKKLIRDLADKFNIEVNFP